MEIWRPVVNFEGIYEVSNEGRVRRIGAWSDGRKRAPHISAQKPKYGQGKNAYMTITLSKNGKHSYHQVHRLVLTAFVGPPPSPTAQANHKDGKKANNVPENLEWCSPSENQLHAYSVLNVPSRPGSKHHAAKITEDEALAIRALRKRGWTLKALAKQFGLSPSTVCWIAKGKAWKHI